MLVQTCSIPRPVSRSKNYNGNSARNARSSEDNVDVLLQPCVQIGEELEVAKILDECRVTIKQEFTNEIQNNDSIKYLGDQNKTNSHLTETEKKLQNKTIQIKRPFKIHMDDHVKQKTSVGYGDISDIFSHSLRRSDEVSEPSNTNTSIPLRVSFVPSIISKTNVTSGESTNRSLISPTSPSADDIVQKKSCLDKRRNFTERPGHRVTFDDKNLVVVEDADEGVQISIKQPQKIMGELTLIPLEEKLNLQKYTSSTQNKTSHDHLKHRTEEDEWDNPFKPEGEVSQDADLMLQLWKEGRLGTEDILKTLDEEIKQTEIQVVSHEAINGTDGVKCEKEDHSVLTDCSATVESQNTKSHKNTSIVIKKNWITTAWIIQKNILAVIRNIKVRKRNNAW